MNDSPNWEARLATERAARIRAEEHAAEVEADLEAAVAASRAKSAFLAGISRELRNPMNAVIGTASLLGMTDLDEEQRDAVETIDRSASSLVQVLNQILDLSRIEAEGVGLNREPFDAADAAGLVCHLLSQQVCAETGCLRLHVDPAMDPHRTGDELRFRQIVTGLVQAVVRWGGDAGVDVELTGDERGLRLIASTAAPASRAEPFPPESHAGLGLTLTRRIVEAMGGTVRAEAEPLVRYTVELPLAVDRPQAAPDTEQRPTHLVLQGRVLLAEDEPVNRRIVTAMLASAGAEVVAVENGREALEAFEAGGFDIVLLDWHMPELSGTDAARAMRAFERSNGREPTPLVALTASAMAGDAETCLAAGMDAYLTKPIRFEELIAALGQWAERRRRAA